MTTPAQLRVVLTNVEAPDSAAKNAATIRASAVNADVIAFNEASEASSRTVIRSLSGFASFTPGENCIAWRTAVFELVASGHKLVMQGGYVGADGTRKGPDNRRVGPSRYVAWVVLRHRASGRLVIVATHHAIAQADTKHPWRRKLRAAGFAAVGVELRAVRKRYPDAALVLTGDVNARGAVSFGLGETEVKTPITLNRSRYDRVFLIGAVARTIATFKTDSDHKSVRVLVELSPAAGVKAAPVKAKPKVRFPGSPVAHPWARRTAKWKRNHPRVWKRIVAWRKKNKRP